MSEPKKGPHADDLWLPFPEYEPHAHGWCAVSDGGAIALGYWCGSRRDWLGTHGNLDGEIIEFCQVTVIYAKG